MLVEDEDNIKITKDEGNQEEMKEIGGVKKRTMKASTLAELTLEYT